MAAGISLIIPFFNEASVLGETLDAVWAFVSSRRQPFEILLADDGSSDSGPAIAVEFGRAHPEHCRILRNPRNLGKGAALALAFKEARLPLVAYIDADLEIGLPYLEQLLARMEDSTVEICIGSKLLMDQPQIRAYHRKCASVVFNGMVRLLLGSKLTDHQCGLKIFRKEVLDDLLARSEDRGWTLDTELLLLAQKAGYRIFEIPVQVSHRRKSTVPFVSTVFTFLQTLLAFRRRGLGL